MEGAGFELPVPDERGGYGLAFVCRVMGLLFGAQLLGFEGGSGLDFPCRTRLVLVELNADPADLIMRRSR